MKVINIVLTTVLVGNVLIQLLIFASNSESLTSYKHQLSDYEQNVHEWPAKKQADIQRIINMRKNQIPQLEYNNDIFIYNVIFSVFGLVVLIIYQVLLNKRCTGG